MSPFREQDITGRHRAKAYAQRWDNLTGWESSKEGLVGSPLFQSRAAFALGYEGGMWTS